MKQLIIYGLLCSVALLNWSCFDNLETVYSGPTVVENNEAVTRNPAVGRTYPIISLGNSVTAGATVTTQFNLVGPQRSSDLMIAVLPELTGTTAAATSYTLSNNGTVVIPANTSIGSLTMTVGRATSTTAPIANLVLVIDSTRAEFKPSQNYKRIGFSFRQ